MAKDDRSKSMKEFDMALEESFKGKRKSENDEEIVKVDCSYCGKEIECPKDMIDKVDKYACIDCFNNLPKDRNNKTKIHVDIPMDNALENIAEEFAGKQIKDVFPEIWAKHKDEMKEMSKKELAEKMFGEGLYMGFIRAFTYPVAMGNNDADKEEER